MSNATSYPLQWPFGQKRTTYPKRSNFDSKPFGWARDALLSELRRLGARDTILSTNIPLRQDGLPYANAARPKDHGVAVYFRYKSKPMVFACDKWDKIEDNMRSIEKTIEAIRGIERWGSSDMMERAFTGFAQLEAPPGEEWWDVLQCRRDSHKDIVRAQYLRLCRDNHPDKGGTSEMMAKINHAWDLACRTFS